MSTGGVRRGTGRPRAAAFALLLAAAGAAQAGAGDHGCRRADPSDGGWVALPGCTLAADGRLRLSAGARAALDYDADGLAVLLAHDGYRYLRRDGAQLRVITYDNGPDSFAEGLVRAPVEGGLGYFDRTLRQALPSRYDWGEPFQDGAARVCAGCRPGQPDADGHTPLVGGRWFWIDHRGEPVPPPAGA